MAYIKTTTDTVRADGKRMDVIPVIDGANVVRLPNGRAIMVGAPPEALKVLLLWDWPTPYAVVLAPDPLYAHGINQASFEFLLYNFLFRERRVGNGEPFYLVCDEAQCERVQRLVTAMLRGPDEAQMAAWSTPLSHRRQLLRETVVVSGPTASMPIEDLVQVVPIRNGVATLPDGVQIHDRPPDDCIISAAGSRVKVSRRPRNRGSLPFFFPEPDRPAQGARFGIQVIGSGSGFSPFDWSSCFIVWINGLPLIVDGTPYLDEHLARLGIEEDHVIGYLITHNHEDHANAIGQLVNRRRVTVLTAPPVMAGLVTRLSAILGLAEANVKRMLSYVPLRPGLSRMGPSRHWFGAEIRAWYSVHTLPTVGVDISMNGHRIRLPGDTLWGRQLEPLCARGVISHARERFIQGTYEGADIVVADAGGGPIHPDPHEVSDLQVQCSHRLLVTHAPLEVASELENARSGAMVALQQAPAVEPDDLLALSTSPALRGVPERWLLGLLNAGHVLTPETGQNLPPEGALAVLRGRARLAVDRSPEFHLQRGDLFHPQLLPGAASRLDCAADWTRVLCIPDAFYRDFIHANPIARRLRLLYQTRGIWNQVTQADLPLETLCALSGVGRHRRFSRGAAILREGEHAENFYVLTSGSVEVVNAAARGGRRRLGAFGPGYSFGEIGLMDSTPRTATVRAVSDVTVLELSGRAFHQYLLNIPLAHFRFSQNRTQRLAELRSK
jgi:CRP-like cAMP-binding protein